jgi:hypothetical protein
VTTQTLYGLAIACVWFISLGVVLYVKSHLRALLVELCGNFERARFWLAFLNVTLVLIPLIFALEYRPDSDAATPSLFEFAAQLKYGLAGLVGTFAVEAIVLSRYIPKHEAARGPGHA